MKVKKVIDIICLSSVILFAIGFFLTMTILAFTNSPNAPATPLFKSIVLLEMLDGILFLFSILWVSYRASALQKDYPRLFLEPTKKKLKIFHRVSIIFGSLFVLFFTVMMNLKGH